VVGWVIYIAGDHCLSEVSSNPVYGQHKLPVFFRRFSVNLGFQNLQLVKRVGGGFTAVALVKPVFFFDPGIGEFPLQRNLRSYNRASTLLHMYNKRLHLILKELAYGPAPNGGLPRYF